MTDLYAFSIKDERGKYDNAEDEEEDEEGKFVSRSSEGVDENFETWRVSR